MKTTTKDFTYSFRSSKTPQEVFALLLNVPQWWSGVYNETINGESKKIGDEFIFKAGEGMHHSTQKLEELIPGKKVTWLVKYSNLSFLHDTSEWTGTKIGFEISNDKDNTTVIFTHNGLVPGIECYNACSAGWTNYLQNLEKKLK